MLRKLALLACLAGASGMGFAKQAPDFPADLKWLNTEKPLTLSGLRGKIVLLDFWTFCCINCMHVLPELHALEEKYRDELVVVGVHSAKFTAEQASAKISKAIQRFKITHPVLNDHNSKVWDLYGVQAWPTLVLISPDGEILESYSGEGNAVKIDAAIQKLIKNYSKELKRAPLSNRLEAAKAKPANLAFPGKLLADEKGARLFVADSNHGRIVIARLKDGGLVRSVDGFKNPQGLALSGDGMTLYVCDLGANAVKKVDLKSGAVETLADGLNSPWDLALLKGDLYIAMAGSHQIWRLDLKTRECQPWAGTGRENLLDGPLESASLAQPSGITTDGSGLFSADSESSSIRAITSELKTLNGKGLFEFGDSEGDASKARLQHPLGVHYFNGLIYVADTFNNRIKAMDPASGDLRFFGAAEFDEPGGLWVAGGKLYIADTNHNAVKVMDLKTQVISTFVIKGL